MHPIHIRITRRDREELSHLSEALRLRILNLLLGPELEALQDVLERRKTRAKQKKGMEEAEHPFAAALAACTEEGKIAIVQPPEDPNELGHVSLVDATIDAVEAFIEEAHAIAEMAGRRSMTLGVTTPSIARRLIQEHLADNMSAFEGGRPHPIKSR